MKLNAIPKMFTFRDWVEFTPEEREQRVLNKKRVPDIAKYILDNEDGYLFSSITASYKCEAHFEPVHREGLGMLSMEFEDANFVINDGQHRCAAIAYAITENPALGEETISVLLFPYENKARVQQMFSDLNRFVVKTSKSLDILFDKRDLYARVTLDVIEAVPVFKGYVEKDMVSLPVRSPKLFSLAALYDATEELLCNEPDGSSQDALAARATEYWTAVSKAIPEWTKVKNGELKALELRQENISSHAVVLRALGSVGADLMREDPTGWKGRLLDLMNINWSKKNPDWENVCIIANSVVSNRQARLATKAYIKSRLGVKLTDAEARTHSAQQRLEKQKEETYSEQPEPDDTIDTIPVTRNKSSNKYFIYLEGIGDSNHTVINPTGRLIPFDANLFAEPEERKLEDVIAEKSISDEQIKEYKKQKRIEVYREHIQISSSQLEPEYIGIYREMLKSPNTLPSRMKKHLEEMGSVSLADLKKACVQKLGCKTETSGSIGASLRVLEIEGYVRTTGRGENRKIFSTRSSL
jgi:DNA sulfur modification protein DndB